MLRDALPRMGVPTKLGRCVTAWKGVTRFPEGLCSREGKVRDIFFWSLAFLDGIKCTLGVCPRTMSQ